MTDVDLTLSDSFPSQSETNGRINQKIGFPVCSMFVFILPILSGIEKKPVTTFYLDIISMKKIPSPSD